MDELIRKKCEEYGVSPDVLTPEETEQLKAEIEAEQRGEMILDSILFDLNLLSRGK